MLGCVGLGQPWRKSDKWRCFRSRLVGSVCEVSMRYIVRLVSCDHGVLSVREERRPSLTVAGNALESMPPKVWKEVSFDRSVPDSFKTSNRADMVL